MNLIPMLSGLTLNWPMATPIICFFFFYSSLLIVKDDLTEKQELEKVLYSCLLNDLTEKQELKKVLYSCLVLNDLTEKQELRCCTAANSTI